ncbi:MAG: M15 family metallopeptidase [Bacilli bacterium]|nr:M15 family metallopeptidase [Bacilli bacterium]
MKKKVLIILFILILVKKDDLHNNFYRNIKNIVNPNIINVLVNKENKLSKNFIPSELFKLPIDVSYENKFLKKEAAINFIKLSRYAKKKNFYIVAVSTYRDYKYQKKLYEKYVLNKGQTYADLCSARPGHSEHQTGLAVDVMGSNYDYNKFNQTKEFKWMKKNAYKYGFILRYPKNKEYITGFKYEPWHYRYVGKILAKYLYKNNLTLEEFYK